MSDPSVDQFNIPWLASDLNLLICDCSAKNTGPVRRCITPEHLLDVETEQNREGTQDEQQAPADTPVVRITESPGDLDARRPWRIVVLSL